MGRCWYLATVLTVEETSEISAARRGCRAGRAVLLAFAITAALILSGCGGGETQDEDAVEGTWTVKVVNWKFPERQPLGRPVDFVLTVRNDDKKDIPQLILTIAGMKQFVEQKNAASATRPIWIPVDVSYSDVTPYNSALAQSYNLGPLASGDFKRYKLTLTPLRRGEHRIGYSLAGNLYGNARIVNADETPAASTRVIAIDPTPDFDESIFD